MPVEFDRDEDAFFERCVADGVFPRNDALKQIVLERVVADLEFEATIEKADLNETIAEYYDDYALVRRDLVNFGYLDHDHLAGTYEVAKRELEAADYREISRLERHARDLGVLD
jgi:hypothetical protein